MENNTKTQIKKLIAEMAEKHDYLQALGSTYKAARDFSNYCSKFKAICGTANYRIVYKDFMWNLARLELNLIFLHKTFLDGCEEEYEEEVRKIVKIVASIEKINIEENNIDF